jgi:DNA-binding LacI/PurR family transcriptional regulator
MAATIHDVARLAGVNSSTVSRVLNGKATVTEETREKICAAMQQLDYHPNSVARSLASGLSGAIGVVVDAKDADAFSNVYFSRACSPLSRWPSPAATTSSSPTAPVGRAAPPPLRN